MVITPEESARLDAMSPVPVATLMDRAGLGVALQAVAMGIGYGDRVAVLAGPGNNGGDGYVAARYLRRRGVHVTVHAISDPPEGTDAGFARDQAVAEGVLVRRLGAVEAVELIVDALFGVGFHGTLPDVTVPWLGSTAPVLAIDVPSGLDASSGSAAERCFTAVRTVTFHALKPGHLLADGPDRVGNVSVVDIGLVGGEATFMVSEDDDAPAPARDRQSHKWSAGSVIVVGGAPGIAGAAVLAGQAALSMGAGSVAVAHPGGLTELPAMLGPGVMTRPVGDHRSFQPSHAGAIVAASQRFDVMVLGPGLGGDQQALVSDVVSQRHGALVIDADGLNALEGVSQLTTRIGPTILTPHAGEFQRLTGAAAHYLEAATLSDKTDAVVVLKGSPTFVMGVEHWAVMSGGPELATIGTGDVLVGMIAALWSRGLEPEVAARSAAHRHGLAGTHLARSGTVTAEKLAVAVESYAW